jgi:hypothetical protein
MEEKKRAADDTVEQELRPGLIMRTRRVIKEDGRYLLYFEFDREPADARDSQ